MEVVAELRKIHHAASKLLLLTDSLADIRGMLPEQVEAILDAKTAVTTDTEDTETHYQTISDDQAQKHNILVVDDNASNRELMTRRIEKLGHLVTTAFDGADALRQLALKSFDLILLDVLMPKMNGFQTLRAIKDDGSFRHIPVIMVSAIDNLDSVVEAISAGAEDYLPKTFDPVLLRARVTACIEKKKMHDKQVELYHRLEQNFAKLKELEELRDSLTHMVVHDLRTPLTSLLAGMQSFEITDDLTPEQTKFVKIAIRGGETLLGMINDPLDISKMEQGSLTLHKAPIIASSVIKTAIEQVKPLADERELTLNIHIEDEMAEVLPDEDKLTRTLVNLLGNAIKFTPAQGAITLRAMIAGFEMLFTVIDTGEGIPQEAFGRIFEKFGQVETRKGGRRLSTGLGLTFCKMVAEAHGGRIWVESELGEGSKFTVALPAHSAAA